MAGSEPGERPGSPPGERPGSPPDAPARQLERAPGERYVQGAPSRAAGAAGAIRRSPAIPLGKAIVAAIAGAAALFAVGAVFASTAGLLFVAGLAGGAIGLLLARAAVPGQAGSAALSRREAMCLSIGIAIASVLAGGLLTWRYALGEGGTLGFVDYLLETFGPFVPGELVVTAIAAAWGATVGPVEG